MTLFKPLNPSASIEINAPAELVMSVILDAESYPSWNGYIREIIFVQGSAINEPGAKFDFVLDTPFTLVELGGGQEQFFSFTPFNGGFTELQYGYREDGPLPIPAEALGNPVRIQRVTSIGANKCLYETNEDFSAANALVKPLLPLRRVELGFKEMAKDLKNESERRFSES